MARQYSLSYKILYDPNENLENLKLLYDEEKNKNYFLTIAYSDLGAFLTPLSVMTIQNNVKNFRTTITNILFKPCEIRKGLFSILLPHINIKMKTYVDFNTAEFSTVVL